MIVKLQDKIKDLIPAATMSHFANVAEMSLYVEGFDEAREAAAKLAIDADNAVKELAAARALLREIVTDHDSKLVEAMCAEQNPLPSNPIIERARDYLNISEVLG